MESVVIDQILWFVSCSVLIIGSISYWVSILYSHGLSHLPKLHFLLLGIILVSCRAGSPCVFFWSPAQGKAGDRVGFGPWGSWWHQRLCSQEQMLGSNGSRPEKQSPGCCRAGIHPAHILRTIYFVPALDQEVPSPLHGTAPFWVWPFLSCSKGSC